MAFENSVEKDMKFIKAALPKGIMDADTEEACKHLLYLCELKQKKENCDNEEQCENCELYKSVPSLLWLDADQPKGEAPKEPSLKPVAFKKTSDQPLKLKLPTERVDSETLFQYKQALKQCAINDHDYHCSKKHQCQNCEWYKYIAAVERIEEHQRNSIEIAAKREATWYYSHPVKDALKEVGEVIFGSLGMLVVGIAAPFLCIGIIYIFGCLIAAFVR